MSICNNILRKLKKIKFMYNKKKIQPSLDKIMPDAHLVPISIIVIGVIFLLLLYSL